MGGDLKEYQIAIDPARLAAHKMNLGELTEALSHANVNVGGGDIERKSEGLTLRGVGQRRSEEHIANVGVGTRADGTPVLVRHAGPLRERAARRTGALP